MGDHGSEVHNPAAHTVGSWLLYLELSNGILATEKNASCVDAHVSVEHVFVDLIDGQRVASLGANACVVYYTVIIAISLRPSDGWL